MSILLGEYRSSGEQELKQNLVQVGLTNMSSLARLDWTVYGEGEDMPLDVQ